MVVIQPQYRESQIIPSSDDQQSSFSTSTPGVEDDRSSLASTRPPTPIIEDDQLSSRSASSRPHTLVLEHEQFASARRDISLDNNKKINEMQSMLVKQGRQIRAIYELQKFNMEKVEMIYGQLKKLTKEKDNELSPKVFAVSNFISNSIILR